MRFLLFYADDTALPVCILDYLQWVSLASKVQSNRISCHNTEDKILRRIFCFRKEIT
jgi:hypothetical protein